MKITIAIIQTLLSVLLITLIFLQTGNSDDNRSNFLSDSSAKKRGWEKILFTFTLIVITIFLVSSVIQSVSQ
ncbi:preprotein translocase subunit SecG [Patescibacteria group bacterium]|nr:preprotein translocase subunit SecG [Patescibacteria group bacterium]